jgi:hypothetical protein
MKKSDPHSKVPNDEEKFVKLEYACTLIEAVNEKQGSPIGNLQRSLFIMQFGQISMQDMLYFIEATGRD